MTLGLRLKNNKQAGGIVRLPLLLLVGMLFLSPVLAPAQSTAQPTPQDLAHRVDQHYNALRSLSANFREDFDGLGMHRSESGTLLLAKPGRMRWDYHSTPGKLFVLDGKYAWFYSPGDTQVQRIAASKLDDLRSPLRFLLGHTRLESELTTLTLTPGPQPATHLLKGIPKGQEKRIANISLSVTDAGQILAIEINELDGARTRFQLSADLPNPILPEGTFRYTPPPGIPIVDSLPPV